jgi:hypothetical protein
LRRPRADSMAIAWLAIECESRSANPISRSKDRRIEDAVAWQVPRRDDISSSCEEEAARPASIRRQ